ncbi:MAG: hydrogenase iron-sulfur subunit [Chloroflexi bacterium]|nr:hydrogenase iron-sulfur subunit [Chloroflexota bacterium]
MSREPLKIYLFCCLSTFDPDELRDNGDEFKTVPLPCSGKIDILYLTKAFETGADGVAVVMCKEGECQYLEGNLRARKRVEAVDALMEEAGLGRGRAVVIQLDEEGTEKAIRELRDFRSRIRALSGKNQPAAVLVLNA